MIITSSSVAFRLDQRACTSLPFCRLRLLLPRTRSHQPRPLLKVFVCQKEECCHLFISFQHSGARAIASFSVDDHSGSGAVLARSTSTHSPVSRSLLQLSAQRAEPDVEPTSLGTATALVAAQREARRAAHVQKAFRCRATRELDVLRTSRKLRSENESIRAVRVTSRSKAAPSSSNPLFLLLKRWPIMSIQTRIESTFPVGMAIPGTGNTIRKRYASTC